jgi:hypothetical protein
LFEVQSVRSVVTSLREIQEVTLGGTAAAPYGLGDLDEVQTIVMVGSSAIPSGSFTLGFDSTGTGGAGGACALCTVQAATSTGALTILTSVIDEATAAADTAAAIQAALNGLSNIGAGGVQVTGAALANGYSFAITFSGALVGGDLPLLTLDGSGLSHVDDTLTLTETVAGSQLIGYVQLMYDDAGTLPTAAALAAGGDTADATVLAPQGVRTSVQIAATAASDAVAAAISGIVFADVETPPAGAIVVSRVGTGGPGITWRVTFASGIRARGNMDQLQVLGGSSPATLTLVDTNAVPLLSAAAGTADVSTAQEGTWLGGSFTLALAFTDADGTTQTTHSTPSPLAWNAPAATLEAALNALDYTISGTAGTGGYGLGTLSVSRIRSPATTSYSWAGEYQWLLTFASASENVPLLPQPSGALLTDGAGGVGGSSVRAPQFAVATAVEGGDGSAEVNEVQLLDCRCSGAACTTPASHFVRLAYTPLPSAPGRQGRGVVASWAASAGSAAGGSLARGLRSAGTVLASGVEVRRGPHGGVVEVTAPIPYSASAAQVRAALMALPSIPDVSVRMYDASSASATADALCDGDGVTTAITFTHNPGPQAALAIHTPSTDFALPSYGVGTAVGGLTDTLFAIRTASAAQGTGSVSPGSAAAAPDASLLVRGEFGGRARMGSRALLPCGGRGTCDSSSGQCSCGAVRTAGNVVVGAYGPSDGAGGELSAQAAGAGEGTLDCGYPSASVQMCPGTTAGGICNGAGNCTGAPGYRCVCDSGRMGPACELQSCPSTFRSSVSVASPARAWFDTPSSATEAHAAGAVCSGRGICSSVLQVTGALTGTQLATCTCGGGFRGLACELMACPPGGVTATSAAAARTDTCSGGNECASLREYSLWYRTTPAGDWLSPLTNATTGTGNVTLHSKIDYSTPWDALQVRGCACNLTRRYVGGTTGRSSSGQGVAVTAEGSVARLSGYQLTSLSTSAAANSGVGGGTSGGSLTVASGWACGEYSCPVSDDPLNRTAQALFSVNTDTAEGTNTHPYEVQRLTCYARTGTLAIAFRNSTSRGFPALAYTRTVDATFTVATGALYTFERALAELRNVTGEVRISTHAPGSPFCSAAGVTTLITFRSLAGELPLLRLVPDAAAALWSSPAGPGLPVYVTRDQPASIGPHACSRRGVCVRETGLCACMPQFLGSDGKLGPGNRGDCGHADVLQGFARDVATVEQRVQDYPGGSIFGL